MGAGCRNGGEVTSALLIMVIVLVYQQNLAELDTWVSFLVIELTLKLVKLLPDSEIFGINIALAY